MNIENSLGVYSVVKHPRPLKRKRFLHQALLVLLHIGQWFRYGPLHEKIVGFAGDHVVAEVEIIDVNGVIVGYWCYGSYDPAFPFQGYPNEILQRRS